MTREPYIRGRLLLAGIRWRDLSLTDRVDVAEAMLFEPHTHGAHSSIDSALDAFAKAIRELHPDPETFGESREELEREAAAEAIFGGAAIDPELLLANEQEREANE